MEQIKSTYEKKKTHTQTKKSGCQLFQIICAQAHSFLQLLALSIFTVFKYFLFFCSLFINKIDRKKIKRG